MDGPTQIRAKALQAIDAVISCRSRGGPGCRRMVANRPDWCISRQRAWGVPIAVFVDRRTGEPLRDPEVLGRVVAAFERGGRGRLVSPSPPERFLGQDRDPDDYEQVMDIVDVWFESGSTHGFAMEDRGEAAGRRTCIWRDRTSIAAGSTPRCSRRSAPAARRRTGRC